MSTNVKDGMFEESFRPADMMESAVDGMIEVSSLCGTLIFLATAQIKMDGATIEQIAEAATAIERFGEVKQSVDNLIGLTVSTAHGRLTKEDLQARAIARGQKFLSDFGLGEMIGEPDTSDPNDTVVKRLLDSAGLVPTSSRFQA